MGNKATAQAIGGLINDLTDDELLMLTASETRPALKEFLKNPDNVMASVVSAFKVWKTLKLGTDLTTADDFRTALKRGGNKIGDWANDILGKPAFTVATKETEVDLVKVTVAELGFKNGATRQDIYQRAKELGLELCPAEVGPQLRLRYQDQPLNEWLVIAMEPISGSDGCLKVFGVGHDGRGRWLSGDDGRPGDFWNGSGRFVFLRRK